MPKMTHNAGADYGLRLLSPCPCCKQLVSSVDADYRYDETGLEPWPGFGAYTVFTFGPCGCDVVLNDKITYQIYDYPDTPEGKKSRNAQLYNYMSEAVRARNETGNCGHLRIRGYGYPGGWAY